MIPSPVDFDINVIGTDMGNAMATGSADQVLAAVARSIAQLIVAPVIQAQFVHVDEMAGSDRNAGGFGSTGRS